MATIESRTRHLGVVLSCALLSASLPFSAVRAQGTNWPRQFESTSGTFVVYQPQPEQLAGNLVMARAAFSLQKSDADAATFGVLWFQAHVDVDRDRGTVAESDLDVTRVRLPGASDAEAKRYEHLVEAEATGWDLSGSLEELQSGLSASAKERLSLENLDHTPPRIFFSTERALLVSYDGAPQLEDIEDSPLQRVANTAYAVVFDPSRSTYYLSGANLWYQARDPLGPWSAIAAPPPAVAAVVPPDTTADDQVSGSAPIVITATAPTELIVTDGEPLLEPLVGSSLFYVTNTECDVLREEKSQLTYVLLSGRWYSSPSQAGPWKYVPADALPAVFRQIPANSPKGNLLANISGTEQADDALADNQIPQTSAISRDDHDVTVDWDGPPQFDPIDGTYLRYGVNTDAEVVLADGRYYLCDQGVWYVADDPNGPWSVSAVRPLGLDDLVPSCPVYNLRYVEIYQVTPDVVEVGYLPGYLGYYPCRGTVVYGSGYRYKPWRGRRHYYPRPCTWGFRACYNPWLSRWSFGFSYSSGFLRVGLRWHTVHRAHPRAAPWLGPGGFHRPLLAQDRSMLRMRPARVRARFKDMTPANLYTRSENIKRIAKPGAPNPHPRVVGAGRPASKPDDVFAGQDGKVYQRGTNGEWRVNQGEMVPTRMPVAPVPPVVPVGGRGDDGKGPRTPGEGRRPQLPPTPVPVQPTPEPSRSPAPERMPVQPVTPPVQQPAPSRPPERPPIFRQPVQPQPPQPQSPGGLERDFRARERAGNPPPAVRPQAPPSPRPAQPQGKKEKDGGPRHEK